MKISISVKRGLIFLLKRPERKQTAKEGIIQPARPYIQYGIHKATADISLIEQHIK